MEGEGLIEKPEGWSEWTCVIEKPERWSGVLILDKLWLEEELSCILSRLSRIGDEAAFIEE